MTRVIHWKCILRPFRITELRFFCFFRILFLSANHSWQVTNVATLDTLFVPAIVVSVNQYIALTSRATLKSQHRSLTSILASGQHIVLHAVH